MQAYTMMDLVNRTMLGDEKFYDAREVDELLVEKSNDYGHEQAMRREAERKVELLESALQSCVFAMLKQREAAQQWTRTIDATIDEAQKVLALSSTG